MKLKRQYVTVRAGSRIIGTLDGSEMTEFVLKEDICVWIEGQDAVEVKTPAPNGWISD